MLATERTCWWWNVWCAETCRRFTSVWCVYILVHVKLVMSNKFMVRFFCFSKLQLRLVSGFPAWERYYISACTEQNHLEHGHEIAQEMVNWTSSRKETYSSETTACGSRLSVTLCTTRRHIQRGDVTRHTNLELEWKWVNRLRKFCSREWNSGTYRSEGN
jgi:hypothetical protein